jgi:Domain of unknown function (DUF4349)
MRLRTVKTTTLCLGIAALGLFGTACGSASMAQAEMPAAAPMAPAPADSAVSAQAPAAEAPASLGPSTAPAPSPGAEAAKASLSLGGQAASSAKQAKASSDEPKLEEGAKPLLIYQGALGIEVPKADLAPTIEKAIDVAESFGGFILTRNDTSVELRVPSAHFREATLELGKLGRVTRRSVTAQDVSEEFHDLGVRLKNLESVRARLEQFLSRATNVDEALRVGKELETVAQQIDQIKGRMQYLKTRATYSLISIALTPKPEAAPIVAKDPPMPPPRRARMPVTWLRKVGLDGLLDLESHD